MNVINPPALGPVLSSFFNDYLKLQKGLRPNSIRSYADAMRLFLQFAAKTSERKITHRARRSRCGSRVEIPELSHRESR